ncbi:hypothetical protein HKBW3S09_01167 [Candidatus Hakubella thermalkaliphila]|uniref:HD domain-containing protein n=1 Tax=Candidatus Hakubella thermalkaliphila TaxID=2754717 RepID=A0A6V8NTS6_9ACTN|nr:hypothetical protein HKBW3S09_01167 [Candidatus Hakubella thermalkaliphila]
MNQNQDNTQLENSQYFQDFVGDGHLMINYQEFDQSFVDRLVEKLRALYEPDLFSHSYQTMAFAERMAEKYGVDQGRTKVASLLHDYGRVFPPQDLVALVQEKKIPCTEFELETSDLLHALAGPELIREKFRDMGPPGSLSGAKAYCGFHPNVSSGSHSVYFRQSGTLPLISWGGHSAKDSSGRPQ